MKFSVDILQDFPLGLKWFSWEVLVISFLFNLKRFGRVILHWLLVLVQKSSYCFLKAKTYVNSKQFLYFEKINLRRKCPACGFSVLHEIRFRHDVKIGQEDGAIMHTCPICKASSGEPPIVAFKGWFGFEKVQQAEQKDS